MRQRPAIESTSRLFFCPLHLFPSLDLTSIPNSHITYTKNKNACFVDFDSVDAAVEFRTNTLSSYPGLKIEYLAPKPLPSQDIQLPRIPCSHEIPGLRYFPEFLSVSEESALIALLDAQPWNTKLKRRVQHYGRVFDYSTKKISPDSVPAIPPELYDLLGRANRLTGLSVSAAPQLTVNEYVEQVGISAHCDTHSVIGDVIFVISLLSAIPFDLSRLPGEIPASGSQETKSLWVERGSLLVLSGEARYGWLHAISRRTWDVDPTGTRRRRERRVSLTFREVLEGFTCACAFPEYCDSRVGVVLPDRLIQ